MIPLIAIAFGATLGSLTVIFAAIRWLDTLAPRLRAFLLGAGIAAYALMIWSRPASYWISDTGVLLASIVGAFMLGGLLGSRSAVVAFCLAVALVDILSSSGGLTRHLLDQYRESGSGLLPYLAVLMTIDGKRMAVIGIGDLVVSGALFLGLHRLGFHAPGAAGVLAASIVVAFVIGWILNGIPALPFIAAGVIAYVILRGRR